jgi:hypothetical protein
VSDGLILFDDVGGFRHLVELSQDEVAGMNLEVEFFSQRLLQSSLPLHGFLISILSKKNSIDE